MTSKLESLIEPILGKSDLSFPNDEINMNDRSYPLKEIEDDSLN